MYEKEFEKYVSNYNLKDEKIKLKYDHSYRVMKLQEKYARILGFNEEDIELAKIIGLLHDIGRFEQLKVYDTFIDSQSVDHADYSIEQLFNKGEIEKFVSKKEWYPIIEFSIKNHNKHHLPECDDERILKHAKLIRDTDKIDIMYLLGVLGELNYIVDDVPLTKEIVEEVKNHQTIDRNYATSKNDRIAIQFAFAFDIYHDEVLDEFDEYAKAYLKHIKANQEFKDLYKIIKEYIVERKKKHGN